MKPPFKVQGSPVPGSTVPPSSLGVGCSSRSSRFTYFTARAIAAQRLNPPPKKLTPITKRETETLCHLALGLITKEIAPLMGVSESAIERHRVSLYRKLHLTNQVQLAHYALHAGLIHNLYSVATYEI